jgi:hypothetical protein
VNKPYSPDEIATAMAEQLGLPGKAVENRNARLEAAHGFAVEHIIKLADAMDAAGFTQVADMLDGALRSMMTKKASAYADFQEALKAAQPGDCQAVHGIYKRFAAQLEGEDSFMRARQDCLAKCPSFKPAV